MGMGVVQPSIGVINSAISPVQPLPSPVKGGEVPTVGPVKPPFAAPVFPQQPPRAQSGYFPSQGSYRPMMGNYMAPMQPYQQRSFGFPSPNYGGKGGGFFPMAMDYGMGMNAFSSGFRGPTYAPNSFGMNQGPFGGGRFRRNFGTFNQGPFPLPQIANAYQGPMGMGQPFMDTSQQVQRMSAEDAYKQAQIDAQKSRASGNMGRVVLPGEMKFEDFEKNYNLPQQQLLGAVGTGTPLNQGQVQLSGSQQNLRPEFLQGSIFQAQQQNPFHRGNALGGLGALARLFR